MSAKTEREAVVFIQYDDDGRPFSVIMASERGSYSYFDFDWSEVDRELYWHLSGCGPASPVTLGKRVDGKPIRYWAAPSAEVKDPENGRRLARPSRKFPPTKLFEHSESETVWCSECKSMLSTEPWRPCDHVWWCDEMGWWSTPDERCGVGDETCQSEHQ